MDDIYFNDFHRESQERLKEYLRKQRRLSPQEFHEMILKHKAMTRGIDDKTNTQNSTEKINKTN